ncbi:NAD(P)-binding protein, partial [Peniophora sp. CONT]
PWEAEGRGKYAGQAAVITSGSSSVGQFAIQLAKLSGFSIIITTASKHNEAYCKSAGATHFLDYHDVPYPELPAAVKKILPDDMPLTYFYDAAASPESQKAGWEVLSPGGAIVVVLPPSPEIGTPGKDDEKGRRTVWVYGGANDPDHQEFGAGMYAALTGMLERGELKPNKVENIGHGLEVIAGGLAKLEKGVSGVKLVATL